MFFANTLAGNSKNQRRQWPKYPSNFPTSSKSTENRSIIDNHRQITDLRIFPLAAISGKGKTKEEVKRWTA